MFPLNSGFEAFQERLRSLAMPEHHFADQLLLATKAHMQAQRLADLGSNHAANSLALAFPNYVSAGHSTLLDQIERMTRSGRQLLDSVGVFKEQSELILRQVQPIADMAEGVGARALAAAFPRGIPDYVSDSRAMLAGHLERLTEVSGISIGLPASVLGRNAESLLELFEPFSKQFAEAALRSVRLDAGRVLVDDEELDADEVGAATADLSGESSLDDFLARVLALLPTLSKPVAWFVLYVVVPYFVSIYANLTTPYWEPLWNDMTGQEPRIVQKQIIRDVRQRFDLEELKEYRFITASEQHVRAMGKRSAEILDSLPMGKTVRVLQRDRDWTEIEYETRDDGNKTGWVFSRYLRRFDR